MIDLASWMLWSSFSSLLKLAPTELFEICSLQIGDLTRFTPSAANGFGVGSKETLSFFGDWKMVADGPAVTLFHAQVVEGGVVKPDFEFGFFLSPEFCGVVGVLWETFCA